MAGKTHDYIKRYVADNTELPEELHNLASEQIETALNERGIDQSNSDAFTASMPIIVSAVAFGLMSYSNESEAFVGKFINAIIDEAIEPILSVLEKLQDKAMAVFEGFQDQAAQSTSLSITSAADSINTTSQRLENQRIKRATAPTPQEKSADKTGVDSGKAKIARDERKKAVSHELTAASLDTDLSVIADDFEAQLSGQGNAARNLHVYAINKDDGIKTDEDHKHAANFVKNAVGVDMRSPSLDEIDFALTSSSEKGAKQMMARKATALSRRQIAMQPLVSTVADNENRGSPGMRQVIKKEVDRTFGAGSGQYRKQVRSYADPTPLLAELVIQTAFSNAIAFEQLEQTQQQLGVESVQTLELLDKE